MRRALLATMLGWALVAPATAWAKQKPSDDDAASDDDDTDAKAPAKARSSKPDKSDKGDDASDDDASDGSEDAKPVKATTPDEPVKQDLNGHDLGAKKGANEFEHDRFFVDKTDTKKTEKTTLVQGSLTSTSFLYTETGAQIGTTTVPAGSPFSRLFTDLRLQTDFRHIGGGRWDARIDARGRLVETPDNNTPGLSAQDPGVHDRIQSGAVGENELDLRELWLVRNGERSDVTIGRQYINDLTVKIDGVRLDYASSNRFTYLAFAGLYPLRGSRSIFTDYPGHQYGDSDPATGERKDLGRELTGAAGAGAAYRTANAYGAFGGVALVPESGTDPRVFVTSNGYWRFGSTLDFYHFALVDVANSAGLTNLSLGLNYKPTPELRVTANFNHVDTESLNVQASSYLNSPDTGTGVIQNEVYVSRIATNEARAGVSAGLGNLQRFQLTVTGAFRYRPSLTLTPPGTAANLANAQTLALGAAQSFEVYASAIDRHSIAGLRIGLDGSRVFGVGDSTYYRNSSTQVRLFASREFRSGRGEWEAEASYLSTKDDDVGKACATNTPTSILSCYGDSEATILSLGGTVYYRLNRNWFAIGSLFLNRESLTEHTDTTSAADPAITGVTAFFRIAYRF